MQPIRSIPRLAGKLEFRSAAVQLGPSLGQLGPDIVHLVTVHLGEQLSLSHNVPDIGQNSDDSPPVMAPTRAVRFSFTPIRPVTRSTSGRRSSLTSSSTMRPS